MPIQPVTASLWYICGHTGSGSVDFDDFEATWTSPMAELLWYVLPPFLRAYPLDITASGDLALTENGVTCLLQDVADILESPQGSYRNYPDVGAGVKRFLGQPNDRSTRERLALQIAASLKRRGIAPRVASSGSAVSVEFVEHSSFLVTVTVAIMDGETVVPLNLVYRYGVDGLSELFLDPASAPLTQVPVGPDGYEYPALGRDLKLDRSSPATSSAAEDALPQRALVNGYGMELDRQVWALVEARDDFFLETADATALDEWLLARDMKRKDIESDAQFRQRGFDELEGKRRDGTLLGLNELCEFYGFDVTATEGYTITGPESRLNAYWAQIWLDMTAVDGTVAVTELEFYQRVLRRKRAARRVVFKHISGDVRHWNEGNWSNGNWNQHYVFVQES